jgi:ABC-type Fe3+/spermidine/putrescine transport system ATPase subunit
MATGIARVRLESVVKRFAEVVAVAGVSLDIARGSLTTILGPSGCGKTTILRLIAGFLEPDAGDILIDGVSQRGLPPYLRKTSTVFQEYALFPHMTVFDNVAYGLRLRRVPPWRRRCGRRSRSFGWRGWRAGTLGSCPGASSSGWRWRAR